jgi:hypothetical protein
MSDPLLDKMDALLKKHKGDADIPVAAATGQAKAGTDEPPPLPDNAWLPVLTDVVEIGEPSAPPAPPASSPVPQATPVQPPAEAVSPVSPATAIQPDVLTEQIMSELEPRLSAMLRDRLVAEVRNSLDDTLSDLLAQMDVHIREIVRETIAEELGKP